MKTKTLALLLGALSLACSTLAQGLYVQWEQSEQLDQETNIIVQLEWTAEATNVVVQYHPPETNYTGWATNYDQSVEWVSNSCWRGWVLPPVGGKMVWVTHCDPYWTTNYQPFIGFAYADKWWSYSDPLVRRVETKPYTNPYQFFRLHAYRPIPPWDTNTYSPITNPAFKNLRCYIKE